MKFDVAGNSMLRIKKYLISPQPKHVGRKTPPRNDSANHCPFCHEAPFWARRGLTCTRSCPQRLRGKGVTSSESFSLVPLQVNWELKHWEYLFAVPFKNLFLELVVRVLLDVERGPNGPRPKGFPPGPFTTRERCVGTGFFFMC